MTKASNIRNREKESKMKFLFPITKAEKQSDGKLLIEGIATSEALDTQGEIMDYDGSKRAFESWRGNLREQHDPTKAVGKALTVTPDDATRSITVKAFISAGAPETQEKILDGTLSMFSVGGTPPRRVSTEKVNGKTARRLLDWDMVELSVVDAGSNPDAVVALAKADKTTDALATEKGCHAAESEVTKADIEAGAKIGTCPECGATLKVVDDGAPKDEPKDDGKEPPPEDGKEPPPPPAGKDEEDGKTGGSETKEPPAEDGEGDGKGAAPESPDEAGNDSGEGAEDDEGKDGKGKPPFPPKKAATPAVKKDASAAWDVRSGLDLLGLLESAQMSAAWLAQQEQAEKDAGAKEPPKQMAALKQIVEGLPALITAAREFVASEAQELLDVPTVKSRSVVVVVKAATAAITKEELNAALDAREAIRKADAQSAFVKAVGDLKAELLGEVETIRDGVNTLLDQPVPGRAPQRFLAAPITKARGGINNRVAVLEDLLAKADVVTRPLIQNELNYARAAMAQTE